MIQLRWRGSKACLVTRPRPWYGARHFERLGQGLMMLHRTTGGIQEIHGDNTIVDGPGEVRLENAGQVCTAAAEWDTCDQLDP